MTIYLQRTVPKAESKSSRVPAGGGGCSSLANKTFMLVV